MVADHNENSHLVTALERRFAKWKRTSCIAITVVFAAGVAILVPFFASLQLIPTSDFRKKPRPTGHVYADGANR